MPSIGGKRAGAGRKKGTANKKTREIADNAAKDGISPLEYMLNVMVDEDAEPKRRDEMAKSAAPFMHPRLAATEITGKDGGDIPIRHIIDYQDVED